MNLDVSALVVVNTERCEVETLVLSWELELDCATNNDVEEVEVCWLASRFVVVTDAKVLELALEPS